MTTAAGKNLSEFPVGLEHNFNAKFAIENTDSLSFGVAGANWMLVWTVACIVFDLNENITYSQR